MLTIIYGRKTSWRVPTVQTKWLGTLFICYLMLPHCNMSTPGLTCSPDLKHVMSSGTESSSCIPCCLHTTPTGSGNIHKSRRIMSPISWSNLPLCLEASIVYLSSAKIFHSFLQICWPCEWKSRMLTAAMLSHAKFGYSFERRWRNGRRIREERQPRSLCRRLEKRWGETGFLAQCELCFQ